MVEAKTPEQDFQKTEVGKIPADWKTEKLDVLTSRIGDGIHATPKYQDNGEYFFVNGNNLKKGNIIISNETKRVSTIEYNTHKRNLNSSTLLLSINGTIGNIAYFRNEKLLLGKSAAYLNINEKVDKDFIFHAIQTAFVQRFFEDQLTGSTIKNLGLRTIRNTPIPLPPTKAEQTAIATALGDMDALIEAQEKLLAKKRLIKQGAMQELLKPKEGWVEKKLGDLFDITSSKRVFQSEWKEAGIPFYRARELAVLGEKGSVDNELFITKSMYENFKKLHGVPKPGDMLVTGVGTLGKVYVVRDKNPFYFKDGNIIWFKIRNAVNPEYLKQLYFTQFIINQIEDASGKTTVGTYTITGAKNTTVVLPPTNAEQERIARILSDMDSEIEQLEVQLEKYKLLKTGMMQDLLTGKRRLV